MNKSKHFLNITILICTLMVLILLGYKYYNTTHSNISGTNTNTEVTITNSSKSKSIISDNDENEITIEDSTTEEKVYTTLTYDELSTLSQASYSDRLNFLYNEEYSMEDRLKVFLGDNYENIGLIYYNLDSEDSVSINETDTFIAASTYKVGLNVLYYYLANIGEIDLTDTITYTYDDYEEGTGYLYTLPYIGSYTIQELLDYSIIYSDNIATNMLGRYLGGHPAVRSQIYDLLGISYDSSENYITPEIEFDILSYLYNNIDDSNYSHLLEVMTETEFNDRLDKYLPEYLVAHKVGNYDTYIHDVGIILDDSPYILLIYTNEITDAEEVIAEISKAFYYYNSES